MMIDGGLTDDIMVQLFTGMPYSCLKNKTKKHTEKDLCDLIGKAIQNFI